MSTQAARRLKHDRVTAELRRAIHGGTYGQGAMLPGETQLAEQFSVSRGTVRKALRELSDEHLIETRGGVGSFVTFDGYAFSDAASWGRPLVGSDVTFESTVLRIETVVDHEFAATVGAPSPEFLAVDRTRHVVGDRPVSLERSRVPAVGALSRAPEEGLRGGSLGATMAAAGLVPARIEQWIALVPLNARDAEILQREEGDRFLQIVRIAKAADGSFVERVVSWLDPERFRVHVVSGDLR